MLFTFFRIAKHSNLFLHDRRKTEFARYLLFHNAFSVYFSLKSNDQNRDLKTLVTIYWRDMTRIYSFYRLWRLWLRNDSYDMGGPWVVLALLVERSLPNQRSLVGSVRIQSSTILTYQQNKETRGRGIARIVNLGMLSLIQTKAILLEPATRRVRCD